MFFSTTGHLKFFKLKNATTNVTQKKNFRRKVSGPILQKKNLTSCEPITHFKKLNGQITV